MAWNSDNTDLYFHLHNKNVINTNGSITLNGQVPKCDYILAMHCSG